MSQIRAFLTQKHIGHVQRQKSSAHELQSIRSILPISLYFWPFLCNVQATNLAVSGKSPGMATSQEQSSAVRPWPFMSNPSAYASRTGLRCADWAS